MLENANIGDIVGLVRGVDKDIGRKPNPMQTWDGLARTCDEPFGAPSTAPHRQATATARTASRSSHDSDVDASAAPECYGRWAGEQRLAVAWTATNRANGPDDMRPKQVKTRAWQTTRPLANGEVGGRPVRHPRPEAETRRSCCGPSGLIGLECDSEQDLAAIAAARVAGDGHRRHRPAWFRRHRWYRPPARDGDGPYVAFRFEHGNVNADEHRYLLMPPAIHPSGADLFVLAWARARRGRARRAPDGCLPGVRSPLGRPSRAPSVNGSDFWMSACLALSEPVKIALLASH